MTRTLIQSSAFVRAAKRLLKRSPDAVEGMRAALVQLADDAFHPSLRTHKLKGDLDGLLACSVGYDLRIVFSIEPQESGEVILLQTVGTHDEVYGVTRAGKVLGLFSSGPPKSQRPVVPATALAESVDFDDAMLRVAFVVVPWCGGV